MLENWNNTKIVFNAIIFALLPALYLLFSKRRNFWVVVSLLFASVFGYGIFYIATKATLVGGAMKFFFNTAFLLALALVFVVGLLAVGMVIRERVMKSSVKSIFGVIMNLGLGLVAFLLVNDVLVMINLFFPLVTWLLLVGMIALIILQRQKLQEIWNIVDDAIGTIAITTYHHVWNVLISLPFLAYAIQGFLANEKHFRLVICLLIGVGLLFTYIAHAVKSRDWGLAQLGTGKFWLGAFALILLVLSFMYLDMGYILAYIPYSTAWDANHAYMFYPRMWALNHGYFWDEINMSSSTQIWMIYIAYRFSLFADSNGFMGISADTIAIQMNFWSGIFVLVFGLGLVSEVVGFIEDFSKKSIASTRKIVFLVGWLLLLCWLFSGMGAFLVFIDNKTDLGVLALIILALYSGFVFLRDYFSTKSNGSIDMGNDMHLIGLSGLFYAIAMLAKPTAAFDVVNFGLFFWWLFFGAVGTIGVLLLVIGLLTVLKFRGITDYINPRSGLLLAPLGGGLLGFDLIRIVIKKLYHPLKSIAFWVLSLVFVIVLFKLPIVVAKNIVFEYDMSASDMIKNVFLGANISPESDRSNLQTSELIPLYAQNGGDISLSTCTLDTQGFSTSEQLYEDIRSVRAGAAFDEDVGRYLGYGWKGGTTDVSRGISPFIDPWRAFARDEGCHAFNPLYWFVSDAVALCEREDDRRSWDSERLDLVLSELVPNGTWYNKVAGLQAAISADGSGSTIQQLNQKYGAELAELEGYMQDNSVRVVLGERGEKIVYFPYKFLNVFNVSFNWSIQNLSSYYTDIGVVWLMLVFFTIVGLIYGVCKRHTILTGISVVTLFGWILWWFVGGGILWYAIGIIIWSILAFLTYLYYLLLEEQEDGTFLGYVFTILFVIFCGVQMVLNLQRIASQGGGGAFIWYKTNFGMSNEFAPDLTRTTVPDPRYTKDDVFALQFPHYRDFIDLANKRDDDEGAVIAGTYARYFVDDQHDIKYDQFLTWLWEMMSDGDPCNSYLRLKDQKITYIVIDPNIGTVVQGAGNQSLFDRFFAKVDNNTNTIIDDGVFTMLAKMYQAGLVEYVSSNNLGAKYAFSLPDESFDISGDALALFRARMTLMRFFGGTNSQMFSAVNSIAFQRVKDGTFVTDLADILGMQIRDNKLINLARQPQLSLADTEDLTNDEKNILGQYLGLRRIQDDTQLSQQVTNVVGQGIGGGNQIIVLKLKD